MEASGSKDLAIKSAARTRATSSEQASQMLVKCCPISGRADSTMVQPAVATMIKSRSECEASILFDTGAQYAFDSPRRRTSDTPSSSRGRHGSVQDLLNAASMQVEVSSPTGRELQVSTQASTPSSFTSAFDDTSLARTGTLIGQSSTADSSIALAYTVSRLSPSRRGSVGSSQSCCSTQLPKITPARTDIQRPPSARTFSMTLSPSVTSLSDNPSRSSIATSDEGGSSPLQSTRELICNNSLEVLSAPIPVPLPSSTSYGLGITSDRAIIASPVLSLDSPTFYASPAESPSNEPRSSALSLRPESRQLSTSAGAERARWSGIGGPRWAARQNSQPSGSPGLRSTEETGCHTVSWSGHGDLAAIEVPAGATELFVGGSNDPESVLELLGRALPLIGSHLLRLDLSRSGLTFIPISHLDRCSSLTELDLSSNKLSNLAALEFPLPATLRTLIVDKCQLLALPLAWSQLGQLQTLSIRSNALRSLPGWLARLPELEHIKMDDNPFHGVWIDLVRPFIVSPVQSPFRSTSSAISSRRGSSTSAASSYADSSTTSVKVSPIFDRDTMVRMQSTGDRARSLQMPISASVDEFSLATTSKMPVDPPPLAPSTNSSEHTIELNSPPLEVQRKTSKSFIKKSFNRFKITSSSGSIPPQPPPKHSPPPASDYSTAQSRRGSWMRAHRHSPQSTKDEIEVLSPDVRLSDSVATAEEAVVAPPPLSTDALRTLMAYLRDLDDLSQDSKQPAQPIRTINRVPSSVALDRRQPSSAATTSAGQSYFSSRPESGCTSVTLASTRSSSTSGSSTLASLKIRDDPIKRAKAVQELVTTEQTYVRGLQELVDIYVGPAAQMVGGERGDSIVPLSERKAAFGNVSDILAFHVTVFLPDLERSIRPALGADGNVDAHAVDEGSRRQAQSLARVFIKHAAFLRMYSPYITGFDNALEHVRAWSASSNESPTVTASLSSAQRKRIKNFIKQCRADPRHRAINCEALLLLPVQRIPRYKMLLELLVAFTPLEGTDPAVPDPTIVAAYDLASALALDMNERKRESESRLKLLAWQQRIGTGRFKSPLTQPHRTLIKEGHLQLNRVVKRSTVFAQSAAVAIASSAPSLISVPQLEVESTAQPVIALLCSDIFVLAIDSGISHGPVDLFTVLRLHNRGMPASVFGTDGILRLIDSRAIIYLRAPNLEECQAWCAAINNQLSG